MKGAGFKPRSWMTIPEPVFDGDVGQEILRISSEYKPEQVTYLAGTPSAKYLMKNGNVKRISK